MRHILVATDLSARSDRALARAALLARGSGAALGLVHAVDDDLPPALARAESEAALALMAAAAEGLAASGEDAAPPVACTPRIVPGPPGEAVARAAAETGADLLVLGAHRREGLRDAFAGRTAARVIRVAPCPVLAVHAPARGPYRHVLVATDLSPAARHAAATLAALGIAEGARLTLFHAFEAPALGLALAPAMPPDVRAQYLEEMRVRAARDLADFAAEAGLARAWRALRRDEGGAAAAILAEAAERAADLVVIGTRGRGGAARLLLGSTAAEVLDRSDRDVLVVPPPRGAA